MKDSIKLEDYKVLLFKVGQEEYGVHISQVVSIERMQTITPYPNRPPYVVGAASIRNVVTPIIDLHEALTRETVKLTDGMRIIIVKVYDKEIGVVVDAATDVLDITLSAIQHSNLLESKDVSYLTGLSKIDDRLIILLDIEKLLEDTTNLDELKEIIQYFIENKGLLDSEKES